MNTSARVTLACFLAYFVMSGMLSPIGIILPPMADALGQSVDQVAPVFSWLTLGILLGSALAIVVFDVMGLRLWMILLFAGIAFSLLTLRTLANPWAVKLGLGYVGVACGIGLAAAAGTIAQLYSEDRRASMLVITDASFSVAGIAISTLAVVFVGWSWHWASAYLAVAAIALVVALLALVSEFPRYSHSDDSGAGLSAPWPAAVWLCTGALFLFTLGQYSLLWWLPTHIEIALEVPRAEAGLVVSRFWTGMLLAQFLVAWWVLKIGARRLVLLSIAGAFFGTLPLWLVRNPDLLPWLSLGWGLANLGLLKVVIAFATLAVERPSPRLVAVLLFGATSGTAVSPVVTSAIAGQTDALTVLQFGSACYGLLAAMIAVAWLRTSPGERVATLEESV